MKSNLFYVAIAALVMTGCSDKDTANPNEENSQAIGFKSYVERNTKGSSVQAGSLKQDFTVYAYYSIPGDETAATLTPDFMFNQHVTYSAPGFTYTPVKYWPTTGDVDFYAYSPYNSINLAVTNPKLATDIGYPVFTYTTDTAVIKEEDLLVMRISS